MNSLPEWWRVEEAFRGIFERRYFANNGPLVRELDRAFAAVQGTRYAVSVTNESVALALVAKALCAPGDVIVPAYTPPASLCALAWAGLSPRLVDVAEGDVGLTAKVVAPAIAERTVGICGIHACGIPSDPHALRAVALEHGCALFFDATASTGVAGFGSFGDAEIFSFGPGSPLTGGEGASITTDDETLALTLRTMRNFHAGETFADVPLRINGKMSEAQAALALCSLSELTRRRGTSRQRFETYERLLASIPGISVLAPDPQAGSNYARVVIIVNDSSRDTDRIATSLHAAGVAVRRPFGNPTGGSETNYPCTEWLRRHTLEFPNEPGMTGDAVRDICRIVRHA